VECAAANQGISIYQSLSPPVNWSELVLINENFHGYLLLGSLYKKIHYKKEILNKNIFIIMDFTFSFLYVWYFYVNIKNN
jgi:hypothetical protein